LRSPTALWRAYPGAIFYTPDRSGKVQRFNVMSLELDPKNVKSHVFLTLSTCKYCDTKVQQHATANGRSLSCESPVMRWVGLVVVVLTLVVRLRQAAITGKV
jgi:hypothetical protein